MVGFAFWEEMALRGVMGVESTARPMYNRVPLTCCIYFLPVPSRRGVLSGSLAYCVFLPYLTGALGNGESWCLVGIFCPKLMTASPM